ncbi:hypothetical protein MNV_2060018 [Candidatus Methanoperedens nitroreducens]|uniref:Uncharacterized protein n=1 Tax=Candidatus Methanoperedens nitratireducens TaxID=1392998 RepID=A0A284VNK9_9EURY|nr:hypothetical protein MNV_2060018 [Candidatus Methanoperedens nitroreducens]
MLAANQCNIYNFISFDMGMLVVDFCGIIALYKFYLHESCKYNCLKVYDKMPAVVDFSITVYLS